VCDETQSSPLLIYFMSGIRLFYSVAMKQTIVRAHIVRALLVHSDLSVALVYISDDSEVARITWMYILHRQYNRSCFVVLST